jgi:hypothetical protein
MEQSQLDAFALVCERKHKEDGRIACLMCGPDGRDYVCLRWHHREEGNVSWTFTEFHTTDPRGNV